MCFITDNHNLNGIPTNIEPTPKSCNFEIYNTNSLDFIMGKFIYRHGKRDAIPNYADLLKINWFFNCTYWHT